MFWTIALLILGFVFLIKGADLLVDGSSSIAKKYGISNLVIGLTIVAFGTSAPELIVSSLASLRGSTDIALGNIIGSNISNTLLILGTVAVITPLLVKQSTVSKEIPLSFLAILAVGILVNDGLIDGASFSGLTRIDGFILILFFSIFIYYTFGISRVEQGVVESIKDEVASIGHEEEIKEYDTFLSALMLMLGLVGLYFGGKLIVNSGIEIAQIFGMSEALVGLTIVAIGTSLPELAASGMAAYRGKTDIAMGNVVGSNIFNLFWVLGISATISPIAYNPILNTDLIILIAVTALLLFLIFIGKKNVLARMEGLVLLFLYFAYIIYLVIRG